MRILPDCFSSGCYNFQNYTTLDRSVHTMIVNMRNTYRHLAHDISELQLEEHLQFVERLKKLDDRMYCLVRDNSGRDIFSVNIQDIDLDKNICNWGFFKIEKCNSRAVLRCFLDYLAVFTPICSVLGYVRNDNVKSIFIHKDLGFEIKEVFDEAGETLFVKELKNI